jgi:hypothetical protein
LLQEFKFIKTFIYLKNSIKKTMATLLSVPSTDTSHPTVESYPNKPIIR